MRTIINLFAGILFLINTSFANEINYKLNATNITFTSEKSIEFDIYLMNAGESKEEFRYALGQYFLDANPKFANSGTLTYSIVKSELPDNELLIFYIAMNGFGGGANQERYKQDQICNLLCQFTRK